MPPLFFTNVALLAGMAALAVPLVIHLFLRRQRRRQRFSTLQFFLKPEERSGQRHKLQQWLLLAARLLVVALIVLAFARPYQKTGAAAEGTPPRNTVFVLDRSASMLAREDGVSRWTRAQAAIQKELAALGANDRVALVGSAVPATLLFPLMPPVKLQAEIKDLAPGYGAGDLAAALQEAVKLLSSRALAGPSRIIVVSDLQRENFRPDAVLRVPRQIELQVLPLAPPETPNRAVTDLTLSSDGPPTLTVEAADFSLAAATNTVPLDGMVDGVALPPTTLSLPPGINATRELPLPDLKPGWHRIEARLDAADPFPEDNARHLTIQVPTPVRVLCVEPRAVPHPFEEESFFVVSALQPGLHLSNAPPAEFQVDQTDLAGAAAILGQSERLAAYQLVLLPALPQIPVGAGRALRDFVRQGGGLVFWVDDTVSPSRYNAEFDGLLPARLQAGEGGLLRLENGWHFGTVDFDSPVFALFKRPENGDVGLPEFTRRYTLAPDPGARILARFDDAQPLLLTRQVEAGRVALVNTSADTRWTDWPKHKTFVPWLHRLGHYLTRTDNHPQLSPEKAFVAGTGADLDFGPAASGQTFQVRSPAGAEVRAVADAAGKFSVSLAAPGFYSVTDAAGRRVREVAVNLPRSESDLTALSLAGFSQLVVRTDAPADSGLGEATADFGTGQRGFWRALLLGAAGLMLLEIVLANRTFI